ncbi:hypothetical protein COU60_04410 [Candidatus Pacearchaeota archaeon CG10_big_fil_rev_8_21_14_0_10_34_76]|nr:MAG: hypothetical protein COU60_04410 [Candidatus Pacearchaeota archaeon CG10_big_fil_rev_8_21_14_0_10_34_76]
MAGKTDKQVTERIELARQGIARCSLDLGEIAHGVDKFFPGLNAKELPAYCEALKTMAEYGTQLEHKMRSYSQ